MQEEAGKENMEIPSGEEIREKWVKDHKKDYEKKMLEWKSAGIPKGFFAFVIAGTPGLNLSTFSVKPPEEKTVKPEVSKSTTTNKNGKRRADFVDLTGDISHKNQELSIDHQIKLRTLELRQSEIEIYKNQSKKTSEEDKLNQMGKFIEFVESKGLQNNPRFKDKYDQTIIEYADALFNSFSSDSFEPLFPDSLDDLSFLTPSHFDVQSKNSQSFSSSSSSSK